MELTLLYSGSRDSSLAVLLLDTLYDVTLVTAHFGVTKGWAHARDAAAELGYAFKTLGLDREVVAAATARMAEDGYLRGGIQHVHEYAFEAVCGLDFNAIADSARRDDRIPSTPWAQAQSLEDHHGVGYLSPLSGFDRGVVDRLAKSHFGVETGPSEEIPEANYEGEFRHLIVAEHGQAAVNEVSPDRAQSYVHSWRREWPPRSDVVPATRSPGAPPVRTVSFFTPPRTE